METFLFQPLKIQPEEFAEKICDGTAGKA